MIKQLLRRILLPKIPVSIDSDTYPRIDPVPDGILRPFWSVVIPTTNRSDYLKDTLLSVLAQEIPAEDMQILVIDNASEGDGVRRLVEELGGGRIEYFRQQTLTPVDKNWTTCIQKTTGHWVHLLHDDDLVNPGYYATYRNYIETHGCEVIFSQVEFINEVGEKIGDISRPIRTQNGIAVDPYELIWQNDSFVISTLVASRAMYETVGGYNAKMGFGLDLELTVRLILESQCVGYVIPPQFSYRVHSQQISQNYFRENVSIRDVIRACTWLKLLTSPGLHEEVYKYGSKATYSISVMLLNHGFSIASFRHAFLSFRLNPTLSTAYHLLRTVYKIGPDKLYRATRHFLGIAKRKFQRTLSMPPPAQQSELERVRLALADVPRYKPGRVQVYGWDLEYVDAQAMLSSLNILVEQGWNDFTYPNDAPKILDCGANIGLSVLRYKQLFPNARIIAFEPDKEISEVLRRNLERNGAGDVEVVEAAVWIANGEMTFYSEGADGSRLMAASEDSEKSYSVKTIDLNEYLDEIDFIKIDIEGAETEVIAHSIDKLKHIPSMVIEYHHNREDAQSFANVLDLLAKANFQVFINLIGPWLDFKDVEMVRSKDHVADQYYVFHAWKDN